MRRTIEIGLAVAALVGLPAGVAIVARSEPAPAASAPSRALPARAPVSATRCTRTTHPNTIVIQCAFRGGASCTYDVPRHKDGLSDSICVIPRESLGQMPLLGYGTPPPS